MKATVHLILFAASAAIGAAEPTPEARWNAVAACAGRSDERERHACVDDVLRSAGVLTATQDQRDQRRRFGRDAGVVAHTDAEKSREPPEPDRIDLVVASVAASRNGLLTFTTEDGAVWRQIESKTFAQTPTAGQTLTVQKAMLGSFICQIDGRMPFRCNRSR